MRVLIFFFCGIAFLACNKDTNHVSVGWNNESELREHNAKKVSISTGGFGTLIQREGNCMPIVDSNECRWFPISNTIQIYSYTTLDNVFGDGPFFTAVNTKLLEEIKPDNEGFFQFKLDTGKYSVFIVENGAFYANSYNGQRGINPIEIVQDSVTNIDMVLDYAVY